MSSRLATLLTLLSLVLLLPSPITSQSLWDNPVDFSASNTWPPESCVRSCLTGNQCTPCNGYSLTTWVGCSTNRCFCTNYSTAYFYLYECMMANCCVGCVTTDPYMLIYNYCLSTGARDTAAGGGNGGGRTVTTTFTAPSEKPTEKPGTNPCMLPLASLLLMRSWLMDECK